MMHWKNQPTIVADAVQIPNHKPSHKQIPNHGPHASMSFNEVAG